jgi:hypothetical protein
MSGQIVVRSDAFFLCDAQALCRWIAVGCKGQRHAVAGICHDGREDGRRRRICCCCCRRDGSPSALR